MNHTKLRYAISIITLILFYLCLYIFDLPSPLVVILFFFSICFAGLFTDIQWFRDYMNTKFEGHEKKPKNKLYRFRSMQRVALIWVLILYHNLLLQVVPEHSYIKLIKSPAILILLLSYTILVSTTRYLKALDRMASESVCRGFSTPGPHTT
jgi:L-asparagine transporter-like permease